jgi:hypothetical protein
MDTREKFVTFVNEIIKDLCDNSDSLTIGQMISIISNDHNARNKMFEYINENEINKSILKDIFKDLGINEYSDENFNEFWCSLTAGTDFSTPILTIRKALSSPPVISKRRRSS